MKKVLKSTLKNLKTELINIKLTKAERSQLVERAKKYTNGNVSEWIRYSALNLEPNKSDLVNAN